MKNDKKAAILDQKGSEYSLAWFLLYRGNIYCHIMSIRFISLNVIRLSDWY